MCCHVFVLYYTLATSASGSPSSTITCRSEPVGLLLRTADVKRAKKYKKLLRRRSKDFFLLLLLVRKRRHVKTERCRRIKVYRLIVQSNLKVP